MQPHDMIQWNLIQYRCDDQTSTEKNMYIIKLCDSYIPQPVSSTDDRATTDSIVLISNPDHQNNIECSGRIVEKFRHNRFHSLKHLHAQLQLILH